MVSDNVTKRKIVEPGFNVGAASAGDHRARVQSTHLLQMSTCFLTYARVIRIRNNWRERSVEVKRKKYTRPRKLSKYLDVGTTQDRIHRELNGAVIFFD